MTEKRDPCEDGGEYKVGPGRPPRHSQFKPGQSGNPGGKKKGTLNLATILHEELEREVTLKGGQETLSTLRALVRSQLVQALKGSDRAAENVLRRVERVLSRMPESEDEELPERDQAILDRFIEKQGLVEKSPLDDEGADDD